jgi:hypothetical protein
LADYSFNHLVVMPLLDTGGEPRARRQLLAADGCSIFASIAEHIVAGLLRKSVMLCCAQWCQLQQAPRRKLLKLLRLSSKVLRS